jgi:hypothetical protein
MEEFEKDLRNVKHPEYRVERFKRSLRRELMGRAHASRWRLAFAAASFAAATLACLIVIFILEPAVPARLHASVVGGEAPPSPVPARDLHEVGLQYFLDQANASAQVDREFVQRWYADRARPVGVKAVEDEKLLAIRQFRLTSGERVVVLTEIGSDDAQRDARSILASNHNF